VITRVTLLAASAITLAIAGCDTTTTPPPPADLAVAAEDLAAPSDLGADLATNPFCAHLRAALTDGGVASDCAVAYLVRLLRCFRPAGACAANGSYPIGTSCWISGAVQDRHYLLGNESFAFAMNGTACGRVDTNSGSPDASPTWPFFADLCITSRTYDCLGASGADMAGAVAQFYGGTFTCPDGTRVDLGLLAACPEIRDFLVPACDGTLDGGACIFP
jgi:hypothetical protein